MGNDVGNMNYEPVDRSPIVRSKRNIGQKASKVTMAAAADHGLGGSGLSGGGR